MSGFVRLGHVNSCYIRLVLVRSGDMRLGQSMFYFRLFIFILGFFRLCLVRTG
jgi:hypothetical protein